MPVELYNKAYHFTHVDNLPSIARHGLLSHSRVRDQGLEKHDISDPEVQQRRARPEPVFDQRIHDYVPLYLNPLNPMQYKLRYLADQLVMLAIDIKDLACLPVVFTDGNAACNDTRFGAGLETVTSSDHVLRANSWCEFLDGKRRRCAELLVPNRIPVSLISVAYARREHMRTIASTILPSSCHVDPSLFFRA